MQPVHEDAVRLEKLAAELDGTQFASMLVSDEGRHPCLRVANRTAGQLAEDIYAAHGWYWWSWADKIAPVDDVATAAARISRVLAVH